MMGFPDGDQHSWEPRPLLCFHMLVCHSRLRSGNIVTKLSASQWVGLSPDECQQLLLWPLKVQAFELKLPKAPRGWKKGQHSTHAFWSPCPRQLLAEVSPLQVKSCCLAPASCSPRLLP